MNTLLAIIGWAFLGFLVLGYLLELAKELAKPDFWWGEEGLSGTVQSLLSWLRSLPKLLRPSRGSR